MQTQTQNLENQNAAMPLEPVARLVARLVQHDDVARATLTIEVEKYTASEDEGGDWQGWRHFCVYFAQRWPWHTLFLPFAVAAYVMLLIKFFG